MPTFDTKTQAFVDVFIHEAFFTSQLIYDIKVSPGVDTVRISFKTVQPTVPVITCTASDGSVSFAFPLLLGPRTEHEGVFGEAKPLQQGTNHALKIVAVGTNTHGKRIESKVSTSFRTGTRDATIMFDTIKVRNDSDSGGNGELTLFFLAGDADAGDMIGDALTWPYLDINDRDPPFALNLTMAIPRAPRQLWVRAYGRDEDFAPFPSFSEFSSDDFYPLHAFRGERSGGGSSNTADWSNITRVFDLVVNFNADTTFGIELPTADFALAFTVNARIRVVGKVPPPFAFGSIRGEHYLKPPVDFSVIGPVKMAPNPGGGGGGDGKWGHLVGLGVDGAIYHQQVKPTQPSDDRAWMRVPGEPKLPVKAFTGRDGRLNLFAYDDRGGVLYQKPGASGGETSWQRLDGRVSGPLAVAETPTGEIDVFGLGEDGAVYHAQIGSGNGQGDWQRIGEKVAGSLSAFAFADGTVGVFALGRNGEVLHKQRRGDEWEPGRLEWHSLGKAGGERLIVLRPAENEGVVIGALTEDDSLRYLEWPHCPEGKPGRGWKNIGTIEAWLHAQPSLARGARKESSDRTATSHPRKPAADARPSGLRPGQVISRSRAKPSKRKARR